MTKLGSETFPVTILNLIIILIWYVIEPAEN